MYNSQWRSQEFSMGEWGFVNNFQKNMWGAIGAHRSGMTFNIIKRPMGLMGYGVPKIPSALIAGNKKIDLSITFKKKYD